MSMNIVCGMPHKHEVILFFYDLHYILLLPLITVSWLVYLPKMH